jgi:hypothetical protein
LVADREARSLQFAVRSFENDDATAVDTRDGDEVCQGFDELDPW